MLQFNSHAVTAPSALSKVLANFNFRQIGGIVFFLTIAGLFLSWIVSDHLSDLMIKSIFSLLVTFGLLAVVGFASGILKISSPDVFEAGSLSLVDELPDGVLVTNEHQTALYSNAAFSALNGHEEQAILTIDQLFAKETAAAEPLYRLRQAIKRGESWREEFRVSRALDAPKDAMDKAAWYRISVRSTNEFNAGLALLFNKARGAEPKKTGLSIWQIAEVTQERLRQEVAVGSLQEIIDYLDQAPAGFFSSNKDGQVDHLSTTLANWLGIDLADAIATKRSLSDIIAGDGATLLAQATLSGKEGEKQSFDLDLIKQDGTSLPVRLLHQTFFDDEKGQYSRTLVLNRTPGEETADDLRAAEVRFARFFHSAPIAIATIDKRGQVGSTNAAFARMFAKTITGSEGNDLDIVSLVAKEDRPEVSKALSRASSGQVKISPLNVSFSGDKEQTGRLYFSPTGTIDRETGGKFAGSILYAIDTTDQKSMEMRMVQGQKMAAVGQLAGGIAHDFNNVLTAIILGTDELLGSIRPTDSGFKDIISIKQNANRAASLVRQILAFSRRQTLRPEVLNLNDVVSNLSIMLNRLLSDNVHLNMIRHRDLWMVRADAIQFEQVIINLSVNARDAMPAGGTVTIATRNITQRMSADLPDEGMQVGEYVLIEVSDTGSGMTEEVRNKVFEPFFTTKGVGKGTGLGLSMVYGIVKQTGGFIYIDSEVGEGTTFRIYLPRHDEDVSEVAKELPKAKTVDKKAKPDLTGTETILLVEDEEAVRGFSARALRKRGYEVFEAGTGVQALEVMNEVEGRIDLVVSDVMMPEMDGPTMAKEMRAAKPDLRIIFVSGFAREVLDEEDDFIFMAKPYGLKELAAKVKEVLAD
ncbi:MAG: ATP-binding protein [Hyphomicrobiaceae bacterium]|nr:ATP-binding protein [Hyphomicrobiaceae bacterium]